MKTPKILATSLLILILVGSVFYAPAGAQPVAVAGANTQAVTFLEKGPMATLANVAYPNYGLFTCQIVGLNPGVTCYDPYQMRHAYGVDTLINAGYTGKGKTIVIIDAFQSPNIIQELNTYDAFYGLPGLNGLGAPDDPNLGTFTQIAPDGLTPFVVGDPNMTGWAEEITLDVLWAHAIAPGANITLVLSSSNDDAAILSATKYAVDNRLGDIISQSFGENESCMDPTLVQQQHNVFADATSKDMTLFASSGDQGAAQPTCDGKSWAKAASTPASDPLVTSVGGTELHAARYCLAVLGCDPTANPAPGTYLGEVVWNEFDSSAASGGGFSVLYDEPAFQQGTLNGGKQRGVPDIAYSAAVEHGALTYLNVPGIPAGFYLFGGTSAGSPQWSAIIAITDQRAGRSLGFINRALYTIGQAQAIYASSLHDVTSGNNSVVELDASNNPVSIQGFDAAPGWDATTGLGSPSANQLASNLGRFVSAGDGQAVIAESTPHTNNNHSTNGHMNNH